MRSPLDTTQGSEMPNDLAAILFDFDFTLADASPAVIECVNYALGRLGLPLHSAERICRTIGLSLDETLVALAGPEQAPQAEAFKKLFGERADQIMTARTVLLPGIPDAIRRLHAHGLALGIITNKFHRRIEQVMRRDGLFDAFRVIIGAEDVTRLKPDTEGLDKALAALGATAAQTLYAGDSVVDALTAQRAGVRFVAALSGVTPREAFAGYPVYATVASVADLPALIFDHQG